MERREADLKVLRGQMWAEATRSKAAEGRVWEAWKSRARKRRARSGRAKKRARLKLGTLGERGQVSIASADHLDFWRSPKRVREAEVASHLHKQTTEGAASCK
jgi:hypothetical protein